jgi:hypothetical protein
MVQLRGRKIPFGRSAAEYISDAGHGVKATSGSGRPTADPCLRAVGVIQRPFSVSPAFRNLVSAQHLFVEQ